MRPFALGLVLVAACRGAVATATSEGAIEDGTPTSAHPAVGVARQVGGGFCTATLVAPDLVLTAAHCVEMGIEVDAFFTGSGATTTNVTANPELLGMTRHDVVEALPFPGWDYFYSCPNRVLDVALLRLKTAITDIAPVRVGAPPASGFTCTTVGFGAHGSSWLEKREAVVKIEGVRETSLDVSAVTGFAGHGDSGGPLLCDGILVATTSCVPDWPLDVISYGNLAPAVAWIAARGR